MSQLRVRGLTKRYGSDEVLSNIDMDFDAGELVVFVGPSGCGKSTLLRCIAGLEPASSGSIEIDGVDAANTPLDQRGVAMVFQSYALYPHMNVFDNIAFALTLQKYPTAEIQAKVCATAEKLKLSPLLKRLPAQLSGGQRQRVAIGSSHCSRPQDLPV